MIFWIISHLEQRSNSPIKLKFYTKLYIKNKEPIKEIISKERYENVYINIMAQYFPSYKAKQMNDINRKLSEEEYAKIEDLVYELDIKNGYMQELGEHEEEYVPDFNLTF